MRPPKIVLAAVCLTAFASSTYAAEKATMRLVAYLPVQCDARMISTNIEDNRITLTLRRACNTGHTVSVEALETSGVVAVTEVESGRTFSGPAAIFVQPERFVDKVDRFVVQCDELDASRVLQIAASLRVSLETE
jgi:hypothetical protein